MDILGPDLGRLVSRIFGPELGPPVSPPPPPDRGKTLTFTLSQFEFFTLKKALKCFTKHTLNPTENEALLCYTQV